MFMKVQQSSTQIQTKGYFSTKFFFHSPVIPEDRVFIQDDLLEQLNELVWQVSRHEGLDRDGDILWVLGLAEGSLDHLIDELATEAVLNIKDNLPELWVTTTNQVAGLTLEQGILIANLEKRREIEKCTCL
jgi:hypothetical protein